MVPKSYKTCELLLGFRREIFGMHVIQCWPIFCFYKNLIMGFRVFLFVKWKTFLFLLPFFDKPRIFDKVENSFDYFGFWCFQNVPTKFPKGSHYVPIKFY